MSGSQSNNCNGDWRIDPDGKIWCAGCWPGRLTVVENRFGMAYNQIYESHARTARIENDDEYFGVQCSGDGCESHYQLELAPRA